MKRFAVCLIAGLALGAPAIAQEFQPYPTPKITIEQWNKYLTMVLDALGPSAQVYKDKRLVVFSNQSTRTFYIFTTKDHPAHPAWITRQILEEGGQVNVHQIGYFAGSEEAFDRFFREYLQRNEQLKEEVELRNQ